MESNVLYYLVKAAEKNPNKIAYGIRDQKITYNDLIKSAQCVSNAIKKFNKTGRAIGVISERDIYTPIYFFAVLFSGNYYVPIDPDMPKKKQFSIIKDARIDIIIGNENDKESIEQIGYTGTYLSLSDGIPGENDIPDTDKNTPCYMVYTSGSTGKPKGVLKSHGAVISFVEAYVNTFHFSGDEIIGNQTPFFFDASAKDIYLALKIGATIEILPKELFSMPPMLIEYLNEKRVSFISWVPTALSMVAQTRTLSFTMPKTLKKVFFVGEAMPMKHLNYWRQYLPDLLYVNLYGQSELAGVCSYYEVQGEFDNTDTLPMGKPLSNCKIYLIDNETIVTKPGQIGEMYIVSDALAIEYYNDPVKTAMSFIENDFGEGPVRCFKTGDLARFDSDGNLIFESRNDFQIKHMGHRIELGEIEAVAGSLDEIGRCACLYDNQKSKIILFVELGSGAVKTGQEIQSLLRPLLSTYMLPSKVIILEKMPFNANGKIDRITLKNKI